MGGQRQGICILSAFTFVARYVSLSPYINRFLSADTIVPGYANPQSLNRYSYVNNNPLRYTDPTGHFCTEEDADGNIINVNCGTGLPPNGGGGGNSGGGHDDDDEDDPVDYCSTHPESCLLPPAMPPVLQLPTVTLPPYYPNFDYYLGNYPSSVTLHPSDYLFGPPVIGFIPYYSSDGTVIGYFEIANNPGSVTYEPPLTSALQGIGSAMVIDGLTTLGICGPGPHCIIAGYVINVIDAANETVVIHANPQVGTWVPVHSGPYPDLRDMVSPFRFPPTAGMGGR
jgi:hypothetical protein